MAMSVRWRHPFVHCWLLVVASSALLQQLEQKVHSQRLREVAVHEKLLVSDITSSPGTFQSFTTSTILNDTTHFSSNTSIQNATAHVINATTHVEDTIINATGDVVDAVEDTIINVTHDVEEIEVVIENNPFKNEVLESFLVICSSEFLDRSWIVSILCILQYGGIITCVGALPAFACHIVISACVGRFAQDILTYSVLHILGAIILALFGFHSLWECYHADPDKLAISTGKRASTISEFRDNIAAIMSSSQEARRQDRLWWLRAVNRHHVEDISAVFVLVFRAEWGDATQLALVTLQTDTFQVAVSCGSFVAFAAMLWAAAMVGSVLRAEQLRERPLLILNCMTLWVFAAISCYQAWKNHADPPQGAFTVFRHPSMVGTDLSRLLGAAKIW